MDIYPATSEPAAFTITLDVDLSDPATASVWLDGDWRSLTWDDDPVEHPGPYTDPDTGEEFPDGAWTRTGRVRVRGSDSDTGTLVTDDDDRPLVSIEVNAETVVRESTKRFVVHPT